MPHTPTWINRIGLAVLVLVPTAALAESPAPDEEARIEFFETRIRPLLANNCYNCHSANNKALGGLRVDDRNGLLEGGGRGPALVPGDAENSMLIQAVRHTHGKLKMPPDGKLTEQEVADLITWVDGGVAWPKLRLPSSVGRYTEKYEKLRKEHWAWQPLRDPSVPQVRDTAWPLDDIDHFVLAKLEAKNLKPVADADRVTLLRRVTFDLTGLPPTLDEMDAFLQDDSPSAFEKLVDRLLASPAFGERWGRHWLDVARYGESTGSARNLPYPHAWRYRNYVIDAFNSDKPYNQFVREQIAGDLLPAENADVRNTQFIATGFLALGVKDVNQRFKVRFVMDNIDEQIDTVSRAILGLTASCARCHDHKFDPIPTADYYALAGIFHSTDHCSGLRNKMGGGGLDYYDPSLLLVLEGGSSESDGDMEQKVELARAAYEEARTEYNAIRDSIEANELTTNGETKRVAARRKMDELHKAWFALTDPATRGQVALGVREAKTIADTEIRIRGEAEKLGPTVPRGFLSVLNVPDAPKIGPHQSGRLELAQWLTSDKNPLTPRVIVNRLWQHLFAEGLVLSVDNFGVTGATPSNPELLDHLAARFMREGWSMKKLIRTLVLTRAYRLGVDAPAENLAVDPANRLVWRHSPRRLDAEELRDAMLLAAGNLDRARPEGSPAAELKVIELRNNAPEARKLDEAAVASTQRSIYLPLLRTLTPRALEVFDFAQQGMVSGSRDTTTVAPQALYLLNDPFVLRQAKVLVQRLQQYDNLDDAGRVQLAYRLTLGRPATAREIDAAQFYLADYAAALPAEESSSPDDRRAAAWASFAQALLASAEFRFVR